MQTSSSCHYQHEPEMNDVVVSNALSSPDTNKGRIHQDSQQAMDQVQEVMERVGLLIKFVVGFEHHHKIYTGSR
jgi:hypothetical protein